MTNKEQLYNWLTTALKQPTNCINEKFYYDKRDNELFSILVIDYFVLEEDLTISNDITTNYTKHELQTLIDRIKRIENKEDSIIPISQLSSETTHRDNTIINEQVEHFLKSNNINIETLTIWATSENESISIDIKDNAKPKASWLQIWK